jgi:hypothetical protein
MHVKSTKRVSVVFSAWPSDVDFGRDIGMPYPTVSSWKQRGSIPAAYWRDIIQAARGRGHSEITADLLVDVHAREPQAPPAGLSEDERPFELPAAQPSAKDEAAAQPTGHFSRFRHLRVDRFRTAAEIEDYINRLRDEWSHR